MQLYIPEQELNKAENMGRIADILAEIPDTDLHFEDMAVLDDAVQKIRELGEDKIADLIGGDPS